MRHLLSACLVLLDLVDLFPQKTSANLFRSTALGLLSRTPFCSLVAACFEVARQALMEEACTAQIRGGTG